MSEATLKSVEPALSHSRDRHAACAAAVAATEMLVVAASTYAAAVGYNILAGKAVFNGGDYGWAPVLVAVIYGGLCLADDQYDLLGPKWNDHGISRGLAVISLAFISLLTISFFTDTINGYSRELLVTQLIAGLSVVFTARAILRQVVDEAQKRGSWHRTGMIMLSLPGANWTGDMQPWLSPPPNQFIQSYKIVSTTDDPYLSLNDFDRQIAKVKSECRMLAVGVIVIAFDKINMDFVARAVSAFSELPVKVQLFPIGISDFMQRSRIGNWGRTPVLEVLCTPCSLRGRLLKRGLDITVAMTIGILTLPLLAIVSVLIKLDSEGPVLFGQMRHGFNNEPIRVLKFRTMTTFDDDQQEFRQATRDDPRVTRIGRILRRTNIDELPQLINVLRGEMSIVGPRPHAVAHNEMYANRIQSMSRRHNVKPGITGWAQVNGLRGETDTIEKMKNRVKYDLYYIDNWSIFFDMKILFMTLFNNKAYLNAY